jgi:hypothetical protein
MLGAFQDFLVQYIFNIAACRLQMIMKQHVGRSKKVSSSVGVFPWGRTQKTQRFLFSKRLNVGMRSLI